MKASPSGESAAPQRLHCFFISRATHRTLRFAAVVTPASAAPPCTDLRHQPPPRVRSLSPFRQNATCRDICSREWSSGRGVVVRLICDSHTAGCRRRAFRQALFSWGARARVIGKVALSGARRTGRPRAPWRGPGIFRQPPEADGGREPVDPRRGRTVAWVVLLMRLSSNP
jgi:hypothetical protein